LQVLHTDLVCESAALDHMVAAYVDLARVLVNALVLLEHLQFLEV